MKCGGKHSIIECRNAEKEPAKCCIGACNVNTIKKVVRYPKHKLKQKEKQ